MDRASRVLMKYGVAARRLYNIYVLQLCQCIVDR